MTFYYTDRPVQLKISLNSLCRQEWTWVSDLPVFTPSARIKVCASTPDLHSDGLRVHQKHSIGFGVQGQHTTGGLLDLTQGVEDTHSFPGFRLLEALMLYKSSCSRNPGQWYTVCIKHIHSSLQGHLHVCIPKQTATDSVRKLIMPPRVSRSDLASIRSSYNICTLTFPSPKNEVAGFLYFSLDWSLGCCRRERQRDVTL